MTIPAVSWTIDGIDTPLQGWSSGTTAFGGMSQMRGAIRESDARRYPSTVGQGSTVTGYTQGGVVVYQGRLSAPPAIRGGLATFAAQGESVRAAKRATRLNYSNRDYSKLTDGVNPPHADVFNYAHKIQQQIQDGGVLWTLALTSILSGEYIGFAMWTPGQPINRVAYDCVTNFADGQWFIETYSGTGPGTTGLALRANPGIGATTFSNDTSWSAPDDMVYIMLVRRTSTDSAATARNVLIKNLRIGGIATTDTFWSWQLVQDVGGRLGYDTTGVRATGLNVLPLDWTSGSWAELLSYIATLDDFTWGVYEDSKLRYQPWGTKEWTVYQADGATVDLTPLELYNQVTVKYVDVGGAPREVTVTASPDPLAASGIVNVWEESLADVQPDSTLATAVANNLLPRISDQRYAGRIDCVKAYDSTGREAVREIRAGDTVRVADWDLGQSVTLRVFETEQTPNGVALGIEGAVSVAALLGRAGLVAARAPSTAQLPELPPPGPPEPPGAGPDNLGGMAPGWWGPTGNRPGPKGLPKPYKPGLPGKKLPGKGNMGKKGKKLY